VAGSLLSDNVLKEVDESTAPGAPIERQSGRRRVSFQADDLDLQRAAAQASAHFQKQSAPPTAMAAGLGDTSSLLAALHQRLSGTGSVVTEDSASTSSITGKSLMSDIQENKRRRLSLEGAEALFAEMNKPNAKINGVNSSKKVDAGLLSKNFDANKRNRKSFEGAESLFEELNATISQQPLDYLQAAASAQVRQQTDRRGSFESVDLQGVIEGLQARKMRRSLDSVGLQSVDGLSRVRRRGSHESIDMSCNMVDRYSQNMRRTSLEGQDLYSAIGEMQANTRRRTSLESLDLQNAISDMQGIPASARRGSYEGDGMMRHSSDTTELQSTLGALLEQTKKNGSYESIEVQRAIEEMQAQSRRTNSHSPQSIVDQQRVDMHHAISELQGMPRRGSYESVDGMARRRSQDGQTTFDELIAQKRMRASLDSVGVENAIGELGRLRNSQTSVELQNLLGELHSRKRNSQASLDSTNIQSLLTGIQPQPTRRTSLESMELQNVLEEIQAQARRRSSGNTDLQSLIGTLQAQNGSRSFDTSNLLGMQVQARRQSESTDLQCAIQDFHSQNRRRTSYDSIDLERTIAALSHLPDHSLNQKVGNSFR